MVLDQLQQNINDEKIERKKTILEPSKDYSPKMMEIPETIEEHKIYEEDDNDEDYYPPERLGLPALKPAASISVWKILKDMIGKDMT